MGESPYAGEEEEEKEAQVLREQKDKGASTAMRVLGMARCGFLLSRLVMISFGRDCLLSRLLGMARCDFLLSFLVMISFGRDCLLSRFLGMV